MHGMSKLFMLADGSLMHYFSTPGDLGVGRGCACRRSTDGGRT
jgi:hypothetical protein